MECETCILGDGDYCQLVPYDNQASTYPVQAGDATIERQCCDGSTGCTNWGTNGIPAVTDFVCTGGPGVGMTTAQKIMTCPFIQDRCSATQEYSFAKEDTPNFETVAISGWDAVGNSCTYLMKSTSGAPGFNVKSQAPDGTILFGAWLEYDLDEVAVYGATDWPALDQEAVEAQPCNTNEGCYQGDMWVRSKIVQGGTANITAQDIFEQYNAYNQEVTTYEYMSEFYTEWKLRVSNTFILDSVALTTDRLAAYSAPERPASYSGDTFLNTADIGGYGTPTQGMFIPGFGPTGYKPFGALGFGNDDNLAQSYLRTAKDRIMVVSLYPDPSFDQSVNSDTIELELGAYPFSSVSLFPPARPDEIEVDAELKAAGLFMGLTAVATAVFASI